MEEVAAICHAVIVELAGRPSLGNDLKMIRNEFRASEESRYHYSFVAIEASIGHLLTPLRLALRARLWYHYYKFHSIIEQYIQFVSYLPFDSAVH